MKYKELKKRILEFVKISDEQKDESFMNLLKELSSIPEIEMITLAHEALEDKTIKRTIAGVSKIKTFVAEVLGEPSDECIKMADRYQGPLDKIRLGRKYLQQQLEEKSVNPIIFANALIIYIFSSYILRKNIKSLFPEDEKEEESKEK